MFRSNRAMLPMDEVAARLSASAREYCQRFRTVGEYGQLKNDYWPDDPDWLFARVASDCYLPRTKKQLQTFLRLNPDISMSVSSVGDACWLVSELAVKIYRDAAQQRLAELRAAEADRAARVESDVESALASGRPALGDVDRAAGSTATATEPERDSLGVGDRRGIDP
jgi:hypothetical protein